jgi:hypothetical protein
MVAVCIGDVLVSTVQAQLLAENSYVSISGGLLCLLFLLIGLQISSQFLTVYSDQLYPNSGSGQFQKV